MNEMSICEVLLPFPVEAICDLEKAKSQIVAVQKRT